MSEWRSSIEFEGPEADVMHALLDVDCIARWSPVRFEIVNSDVDQLRRGDHVDVIGTLVGRRVRFAVDVTRADGRELELVARGPLELGVDYRVDGKARRLTAEVTTRGSGLLGRAMARAADALLSAGALDHALRRIAAEASPHALLA